MHMLFRTEVATLAHCTVACLYIKMRIQVFVLILSRFLVTRVMSEQCQNSLPDAWTQQFLGLNIPGLTQYTPTQSENDTEQ